MRKKKIIVLSDHALSVSGVGTQTRHLLTGMIEKGEWSFRQFGAALKHANYDTVVVNEDLIIKPIDGFGDRDTIRVTLATEKPDAIMIFTDPRFFIWLFEMEDEIHQICPIVWWHVWDNLPFPEYNKVLYESTDLINCHSHMTYKMIKDRFEGTSVEKRVNFVPHSVPENIFHKLTEKEIKDIKIQLLGKERKDDFVGIWVNRNAKRKRPDDVLHAWKVFLDKLEEKHGHRNATLIMHTDPFDAEGPNLIVTSEHFGIHDRVFFSQDRLEFDKMNMLYNISDFCINISYAEGFGLSTLEAMQTGTPAIAVKTGGLTRQVVDHRDGSENGVALDVELQTLVGSQQVPYIYEDYVSIETVANGIMRLFEMPEKERKKLSDKVIKYAKEEFDYQDTIDLWHETLNETISNWKSEYERYEIFTL
jgi:glycosyltransferase involved in cell wall biosynthesis